MFKVLVKLKKCACKKCAHKKHTQKNALTKTHSQKRTHKKTRERERERTKQSTYFGLEGQYYYIISKAYIINRIISQDKRLQTLIEVTLQGLQKSNK